MRGRSWVSVVGPAGIIWGLTISKNPVLSREPLHHGAHREIDVWRSDDRTAGDRGLRGRAGRGHHVAPRQTGLITLDPGFANTGVSQSGITYVDGENGVLRYRGIPIEQLARHSNFVETSFLLIYGHLPSKQELDRFGARVTANAALHESFKHHFEGFPVDAPPMAMLSAMVNTLACFYPRVQLSGGEKFDEEATWLLSKTRTIAAYSYRRSMGYPFIYSDPRLSYGGDFLHMLFSQPLEEYLAPRRSWMH